MEMGECLRVEQRFLFLQSTAKFLILACLSWSSGWVSFGYRYVPSGHLPFKMTLNKFLPRAENKQKTTLFLAFPLKASGKVDASQAGYSKNFCGQAFAQWQEQTRVKIQNHDFLEGCLCHTDIRTHKWQNTGAWQERKQQLCQMRALRPTVGRQLVQGQEQKPDLSKNWGNLGTSLRAEQAS